MATTSRNSSPKSVSPLKGTSSSKKQQQQQSAKPAPLYSTWSSYEVEPGVRANSLCKANNGALIGKTEEMQAINTAWDAFKRGIEISRNSNCLGWRDGDTYKWWSYQEVYDRVRGLAGALAKKTQLRPQDSVGIYSISKPEWLVAALAVSARSLSFIPLYDTLGTDSCTYIINQAEISFLFIDTPAAARRIIQNSTATPSLRTVVMFLAPDDDLVKLAEERGIALTALDQFVALTKDTPPETAFIEPKGDDICVIMYTSGTTGDPKGVLHPHNSVVSDTVGIDTFFQSSFPPNLRVSKDDIALHYLPLAHAYGLLLVYWFFLRGGSIGFFSGNILKLTEDASILKPTYFPLVPRLMNRVYGKIVGELQKSHLKSKLFWYAYRRKRQALLKGVVTRDSIWDKLVFKKVQALLGGRIWLMSVGSAPVSKEVLEFWRIVFGALVLEGYGQTETGAVSTIALDPIGGNVGHPMACNYIKLDDVPECDYYVKNGRGEICIKGINVMRGYYKQPDKTREAMDADGWLHTGDIGEFLEDGSLRIIDRKKNIFKLAQGEYIAPEKVENVYLLCPEIGQVFVDGSTLESYTVAVVVPEPSMAENFAQQNGLDPKTVHLNDGYRRFLLQSLRGVGKVNKLNSLEQVKSIFVTNEPFTVENNLLTPSLKNKRPELRKYFKQQIEALYRAGPVIGSETNK